MTVGEPGDNSGGDYTGGDDERVPIPEPPPVPDTSCKITSAVPSELVVSTNASSVTQVYDFTAQRGATNATISWNISPTTYGSTFTGTDISKSLTLTFPRYTNTTGTFQLAISSTDGNDAQNWQYQLNNNTSTGGANYWALQSDNSIKNTNANGVVVNGDLTAGRVYGVRYSDVSGTPVTLFNEMDISKAAGWSTYLFPGAPWNLETTQNMVNIPEGYSTSMNDIVLGMDAAQGGRGTIWKVYRVYNWKTNTMVYETAQYDTSFFRFRSGDFEYQCFELFDANGAVGFQQLKNLPPWLKQSTVEFGAAMSGILAGAAILGGGVLAAPLIVSAWTSLSSGLTRLTDRFRDAINTDSNGEATQQNEALNIDWVEVKSKPFFARKNNGGTIAFPYDVFVSNAKSFYVINDSNYSENSRHNCVIDGYSGQFELIDFGLREFYGTRFNAGNWSLRQDGLYYNDSRVVSAPGGGGGAGTSSQSLDDVADGTLKGKFKNAGAAALRFGRGLVNNRKGVRVAQIEARYRSS